MALIFAFRDKSGQWHGDSPHGAIGWSSVRTGWLTFRPGPGQPGADSPFVGQRLEVRYASTGEDGEPGPIPYRLDDGGTHYPTMQVHKLLAGYRDDSDVSVLTSRADQLDERPDELSEANRWPEPAHSPAAAENVRAGRQTAGLPISVRVEARSGEHSYDLSLVTAEAGRVRFELLCADRDGVRAADLKGELPGADLGVLGNLFLNAAAQIGPTVGRFEGRAPSRRGDAWTDEEKQLLTALHAAGADVGSIAAELGRTERAVGFELHELGLGPWPGDAARELSRQPKPPPAYTMEHLRRVHPNSHKKWTAEEDARLATRFGEGADVEELMGEFGRNYNAIISRLGRLGVQREPRYG